jgi:hypothetical protein
MLANQITLNVECALMIIIMLQKLAICLTLLIVNYNIAFFERQKNRR